MKEELRKKFSDRWPTWFGRVYLGVGDGWFDLLWKLCEDLEPLVGQSELQVLQVKEKFGTLRFYVGAASNAVHERISKAEADSGAVCEQCGDYGECRGGGWLKVLCDNCNSLRKVNG